jgi:hypothetical protein
MLPDEASDPAISERSGDNALMRTRNPLGCAESDHAVQLARRDV